jgi:hypothetical protein
MATVGGVAIATFADVFGAPCKGVVDVLLADDVVSSVVTFSPRCCRGPGFTERRADKGGSLAFITGSSGVERRHPGCAASIDSSSARQHLTLSAASCR